MGVPYRHIKSQIPVIATMGQIAIMAANQKLGRHVESVGTLPGPWFEEVVPARPSDLVDDFVRWSGGDTSAWRGWVPPTLFPQWGFPLLGKTLSGVPYPSPKFSMQDASLSVTNPFLGQGIYIKARLKRIDDNGSRAIITQELLTLDARSAALGGPCQHDRPLGWPKEKGRGQENARVRPRRRSADCRLANFSGRWSEFACLTGDFNPIHWVKAYGSLVRSNHTPRFW